MIHSIFDTTLINAPDHRWVRHTHLAPLGSIEHLAALLADAIMADRCRGCPKHLDAWRDKRTNGTPLPAASIAALPAFIRSAFGLPDGSARVTDDHLEGFVAEHLWHQLVAHFPGTEDVVLLESPSFHVTSPGGDGLAIHRLGDGSLRFRLWEIKKATGQSPVSATVGRGCSQLQERAAIYLAEYSRNGEDRHNGTELEPFYGQLIDLWLEASPQAAAGVAVATTTAEVPDACFAALGTKLSQFVAPNRLRGLLASVDDFPAFAKLVQGEVWTGL